MTERRGDQGFTVAPRRIGDGGGRASRLRRIGLVLLIAMAAAIVTIAWLGPRLSSRPNFDTSYFATPTPTATALPSPTEVQFGGGPALATPLPRITRPDGPLPSGSVAILSDTFRILDLATGEDTSGPAVQSFRDAVFRTAGGGWTCVCFGDGSDPDKPSLITRIVGIDEAGAVTDTTDLAELAMPLPAEDGQPTLSTDLEVLDGGHRGLLALATHDGRIWRFSVSAIDVDGRRLGQAVSLGEARAPRPEPSTGPSTRPTSAPSTTDDTPPDAINEYVDGPHVRISPDGRTGFVWATLTRDRIDGQSLRAVHAWRVELGPDGSVGAASDAPGLLRMPTYCSGIGFASPDRLAWLCPVFSDDPNGSSVSHWKVGTVDLDGRFAGETELAVEPDGYFDAPLFDRANGQIYAWDAIGLTIVRIDVHSLAVERSTFDPLAGSTAGLPPGGGSAPVDWRRGVSAVQQYGYGLLTAAPDGNRMYAVGFDPETTSDGGAPTSRGVFVIDRATLALVDRWAPAAQYIGLSVLPGGLVAATGLPGVQADGHVAPWEASLTIHDASDGHVVVRFGQLGTEIPPIVIDR